MTDIDTRDMHRLATFEGVGCAFNVYTPDGDTFFVDVIEGGPGTRHEVGKYDSFRDAALACVAFVQHDVNGEERGGTNGWTPYDWEDYPEPQCDAFIDMGPAHDPYGTSCDQPVGHAGPHQGPHPFLEDEDIAWTGGGSCAGDPLPYTVV